MLAPLNLMEIDIPVAEDDDVEIDLVAYLSGFISDEMGELGGKLLQAFDLTTKDDRAQVYEVSIEDVELTDDGVAVHYSYGYAAHYGCKDMDYNDDETGTARGKKVGEKWIFQRFIAPVRMPPDMEGPDDF